MGAMDIATLIVGAAILVLLVKNPKGSASLIGTGGSVVTQETAILTGTGYKGGN